ncbi:MAG TPA: hypothetical protein VMZ28_22145 [Kofleriaceae bacterium]|nr:hypothetical protein [Kofleriaceae bacterium]
MRGVALAAALALGGCSFFAVKKAPEKPWAERPQCSTELPEIKRDFITAGIVAAAGLTLVVAGAATAEEADDTPGVPGDGGKEMNALMLLGAITLVAVAPPFAASGFYGRHHTEACRDAQAKYDKGQR